VSDDSFGATFEHVKKRVDHLIELSEVLEQAPAVRRMDLKHIKEVLEMCERRLSEWSDHSAMLEMELDKLRGFSDD